MPSQFSPYDFPISEINKNADEQTNGALNVEKYQIPIILKLMINAYIIYIIQSITLLKVYDWKPPSFIIKWNLLPKSIQSYRDFFNSRTSTTYRRTVYQKLWMGKTI